MKQKIIQSIFITLLLFFSFTGYANESGNLTPNEKHAIDVLITLSHLDIIFIGEFILNEKIIYNNEGQFKEVIIEHFSSSHAVTNDFTSLSLEKRGENIVAGINKNLAKNSSSKIYLEWINNNITTIGKFNHKYKIRISGQY